ncbi:GNAT family N-acetyltransferase [Myceligenerans xiligouense]|uniref:GNAT family N-acetyltransferase n=1 Tax=Myceligenerans xiligouense TaxID=253184 RepID=UPI001476D3FF|nr:GNAT family N-acetyltransferase [Myceligenerans xiligouense]
MSAPLGGDGVGPGALDDDVGLSSLGGGPLGGGALRSGVLDEGALGSGPLGGSALGEGSLDGSRVPVADVTGILLLDPRYDSTAEVHLLAVRREHHRTGIGRALLRRAEDDMRARGVRLLTVKTFGPSRPDPGYDRTRAFYEAVGFLPVEEFPDMWAENPCLLMAKVL